MPHEFTATPWRSARQGDYLLILDRDGAIVAQVGSPFASLSETARTNALLLAQAPRLLKHLQKAYAQLVRQGSSCNRLTAEEMDAMQRAIGDAGGSTE